MKIDNTENVSSQEVPFICFLNDLCINKSERIKVYLKVIYHTLYSRNNFVTNKSKLPQNRAQVFPYMG